MIPAGNPMTEIGDAIADTVSNLTRAIIPGASFRLKDLQQNQLRHIDIRATEQIAEVRELRPQGMLGTLLRDLRTDDQGRPDPAWPAVRAGMLSQVELTGFPRLEVAISVVDRFASDGCVAAGYRSAGCCRPVCSRTRPSSPSPRGVSQHWVVNLLDEADRAEIWNSPYVYRVIADFDPTSPLRPAGPPISPWRRRNVADLLVDPRDAYVVGDVTVTTAPMFSFQAFPQVTVELTPGLETPNPSRAAQVSLTPETATEHWQFGADPAAATTGPPPPPPGGIRVPPTTPAPPPTPDSVTDGDPVRPVESLRTPALRATTGGPPTTGRWSPAGTWRPTGSPRWNPGCRCPTRCRRSSGQLLRRPAVAGHRRRVAAGAVRGRDGRGPDRGRDGHPVRRDPADHPPVLDRGRRIPRDRLPADPEARRRATDGGVLADHRGRPGGHRPPAGGPT